MTQRGTLTGTLYQTAPVGQSGGASSWNDLTGKPFETIGENLEVVNGALKANLKNYPTKDEVTTDIATSSANILTAVENTYAPKTSLEEYATEQWVEDKNYLTEHQDLSDYATKEELDNYYSKTQTDELLTTKQPTLTAGENITIIDNVISAESGGSEGAVSYLEAQDLTDEQVTQAWSNLELGCSKVYGPVVIYERETPTYSGQRVYYYDVPLSSWSGYWNFAFVYNGQEYTFRYKKGSQSGSTSTLTGLPPEVGSFGWETYSNYIYFWFMNSDLALAATSLKITSDTSVTTYTPIDKNLLPPIIPVTKKEGSSFSTNWFWLPAPDDSGKTGYTNLITGFSDKNASYTLDNSKSVDMYRCAFINANPYDTVMYSNYCDITNAVFMNSSKVLNTGGYSDKSIANALAVNDSTIVAGRWSIATNRSENLSTGCTSLGNYLVAPGLYGTYVGFGNEPEFPVWTANTDYSVGDKVTYTYATNSSKSNVGVWECTRAHNSGSSFSSDFWKSPEWGYDNLATKWQGNLFTIGNGVIGSNSYQYPTTRSNALTVDWSGNVDAAGTLGSDGADFAEYFEWKDGNPNDEDRIGYIVSLEGDKITYATGDDILGIISGAATVLGDTANLAWHGKYVKDEFGRIVEEEIEETGLRTVLDEEGNPVLDSEGNPIEEEYTYTRIIPKLNPDFKENTVYKNRRSRQEWSVVGMLGKLYVRDDGTSEVNGYVTAINGIATKSETKTNMRVMQRVNDHIIRVCLK